MTKVQGAPKGLGGWLILPAIGLFFYPIRIAASFYTDFLPIFQEGYWEVLTTPGRERGTSWERKRGEKEGEKEGRP